MWEVGSSGKEVLTDKFQICAFLAFLNQLKDPKNPGLSLSYSTFSGYSSALKYHLKQEAKVSLSDTDAQTLSNFLNG